MKRLFLALIIVAFMAIPSIANANVILDPGFEDISTTYWSYYESNAGFVENFDNTSVFRSGQEALEISWTSTIPQWEVSDTKQDISVTAGQPWYAEVYGKVTTALSNTEAYLETIFYDVSHTETGKFQSSKLSGVTTDWTLLTNSGVIPASTVTASYRLIVFTSGGNSGSGTIYFDDAYVIPEPTSLILLASGLVGLVFLRKRPSSKSC